MDFNFKKNIPDNQLNTLICVGLSILIFILYSHVKNHEFVSIDDDIYVTDNHHVQNGLTLKGLYWAFGFSERAYWHPMTWISHMLDCHLFGLSPGAHHIVNVIFHVINTLLLFICLNRMTGEKIKCAFVAAMFAVHPINVESVAWIAERKNLLSTLFWFLTILFYIRYTERPRFFSYLPVLTFFTMGLLAKPTLVTLPFVLILLDYWPLNRIALIKYEDDILFPNKKQKQVFYFDIKKILYRIAEKIPFFFVAIISIIISSLSMRHYDILTRFEVLPLKIRISNFIVSYARYMEKFFFPDNLSVFYPYPKSISIWLTVGVLIWLFCITIPITIYSKRRPFLVTGWFWFIGTLVPFSGIIQAGLWPAMADRWAYIPYIGLFIIVAWGLPILFQKLSFKQHLVTVGACCVIIGFMFVTYLQTCHWRTSHSLFKHSLEVTQNNYLAHNNYGLSLEEQDKYLEAIKHYQAAVNINPSFEIAYVNLGVIWAGMGDDNTALKYYYKALKYNPNYVMALVNVGNVKFRQGYNEVALKYYQKALLNNKESAEAYNGIGAVMVRKGELSKAVKYFKHSLLLNKRYKAAEVNLQNTLRTFRMKNNTE